MQTDIHQIIPLLLSIKYTHNSNLNYDYSSIPRPCHNIAFMLEGSGIIKSGEKLLTVKKGDVLFIPKNSTYSAQWIAQPKAVYHSIHFSFQYDGNPLLNKNIPVQILTNNNFDSLYQKAKEIEKHQFDKTANSFFALSAFFEILGTILPSLKLESETPFNKMLAPALEYLENNYFTKISVQKLTSLCFLSPSRFHYLFKKQTGVSPIVYKNKIAVRNVAEDLLFDKETPIKTVAQKHGFKNFIYFERLFKKLTGKTPSLFRKENILL
ncbi:MAG: helix-turn-helix domain-containing protein [Clostridiales bacterium]|nr:helix-turn-helix domain-containing protein [Clostridiales bacterium]